MGRKSAGGAGRAGRSSGIPVMTEEQYLSSRGAVRMGGSEPALHRTPGGFPKGVRQKLLDKVQTDMKANIARRAELRKEYAKKVKQGKVRSPSRIERLTKRARGDSGMVSVQAARRVLKKAGLSW